MPTKASKSNDTRKASKGSTLVKKKPAPRAAVKQGASQSVASKGLSKKAATKKTVIKKVASKVVDKKQPVKKVITSKKAPPSKTVSKKVVTKKEVTARKVVKKAAASKISTGIPARPSTLPSAKRGVVSRGGSIAQEKTSSAKSIMSSSTKGKPNKMTMATKENKQASEPKAVKYSLLKKHPSAPANNSTSKSKPLITPLPHVVEMVSAPNLLDMENDPGMDPGVLPNDQVFDETDQAQWMQLREQAEINRRGRELGRPELHPDFDGSHCVDCDCEIQAPRLLLGKVRCVDCQQMKEDGEKRAKRLGGLGNLA
jgi:RNA polymerase-binding transcription factor DksA